MRRQFPRLLLASALTLTALGAAPALSDPAPAAAPQALPDPLHPCTVLLCLPRTGEAASALPAGKRMHKPYTVVAATPDAATANAAPAQPAACAAVAQVPLNVASDPEEGGQIARTGAAKPKVGDINVMKTSDKASTTLMQRTAPASACP